MAFNDVDPLSLISRQLWCVRLWDVKDRGRTARRMLSLMTIGKGRSVRVVTGAAQAVAILAAKKANRTLSIIRRWQRQSQMEPWWQSQTGTPGSLGFSGIPVDQTKYRRRRATRKQARLRVNSRRRSRRNERGARNLRPKVKISHLQDQLALPELEFMRGSRATFNGAGPSPGTVSSRVL